MALDRVEANESLPYLDDILSRSARVCTKLDLSVVRWWDHKSGDVFVPEEVGGRISIRPESISSGIIKRTVLRRFDGVPLLVDGSEVPVAMKQLNNVLYDWLIYVHEQKKYRRGDEDHQKGPTCLVSCMTDDEGKKVLWTLGVSWTPRILGGWSSLLSVRAADEDDIRKFANMRGIN